MLAFLALVVQTWALVARDSKSMLPPDQDPWYEPPQGWKKAKLGTILRKRQVEIRTLTKDDVKEAWQLLYRTSYVSEDEPTVTATTILVPHNADADKLVVFGTYIDANGPQCAPSYALRNGFREEPVSASFFLSIMLYLQQGYIVTVPDKQGKKNAFSSGFIEGHQTLDGVRATLKFDKLNLGNHTKVAGAGYSGGALQHGWAAALRKKYAPELNVVGWAIGGTPSNITTTIEVLNNNLFTGLLLGGMTGIYDSYKSVKNYLDRVLTKKGQEALQYVREHCQGDNVAKFKDKNIFDYEFSSKGKDLLHDDELQKVLKTLTLGADTTLTPIDPILMGHGISDEISPYNEARKTYHAWCDFGADVEFITYNNPLTAHLGTFITMNVPMFMWVRDRLEGRALHQKGCKDRKSFELGVNINALDEQFRGILNILKGLLGDRIGPNDKYLLDGIQKH